MDILIGLLISSVIAFLAYLKKSLNLSGLIAAVIFGTALYFFGGWIVWTALIGFFVSSSILTKLHGKVDQTETNVQKNGRNYVQVISNAFVATVFSVLYYFFKLEMFQIAAIVAISTSNADTWASEIGVLSRGKTFSILNLKVLTKGTSGGVSVLGLFASFLGGLFIAFIFSVFYFSTPSFSWHKLIVYLSIITLGGFLGSIFDSLLGASIQAKYQGVQSKIIYEIKKLPNESAVLVSGISLITNDMVNLLSGVFSSIVVTLILI